MENLTEKIGMSLIILLFLSVLLYQALTHELELDITISYGIMFTLLLLFIWMDAKTTKLNQWINSKSDKLNCWIAEYQQRRQTIKMLHDDDNPERITRRRKRTSTLDTIKAYVFFISSFFVFPLAIAGFGIWYMQSNKSIGWFLALIAVLCATQLWGLLLIEYLKKKQEKNSTDS